MKLTIPPHMIRYGEAGRRIGRSPGRIAAYVRYGYLRPHRIGCKLYINWDEALQSRLIRQEVDRFQAELAALEAEEDPASALCSRRRRKRDPVPVEASFA